MIYLQIREKPLPLRKDSSKRNFVCRDDNPLQVNLIRASFKSRYLAAFFVPSLCLRRWKKEGPISKTLKLFLKDGFAFLAGLPLLLVCEAGSLSCLALFLKLLTVEADLILHAADGFF